MVIKQTNRLKKGALFVCGLLSLIIGAIGIFLPLLPTTPFLLLSAACFLRSSERFYKWLMTNRLFGSIIRNYNEKRSIPLGVKTTSIALLWITITYSAFHFVEYTWLQILLLVIAIAVTIHLLSLKTTSNGDED